MSITKTNKRAKQYTLKKKYVFENPGNTKEIIKHTQESPFLSTSRLNRGQRKYCHCLMKVRTLKKILPYGICKNMSYKTMRANSNNPCFRFKPQKTNCIMNYDYSKYSLADVQNLAKERGIPLYNSKTGRVNNKNTIIQLLTKRYIENHKQKKTSNLA